MKMTDDRKILCLFDVDGTLTSPRLVSEKLGSSCHSVPIECDSYIVI